MSNSDAFQAIPSYNGEQVIRFAGGDGDYSPCSQRRAFDRQGHTRLFQQRESNTLRGVYVEFREAVMDFPWMDAKLRITGIIEAWREDFPAARAVNVSRRIDIVDSDFRSHSRRRAYTSAHCKNAFVRESHGCCLYAPPWDPSARNVGLQTGGLHGCSLCAPTRDTNTQHVPL